MAAFAQLDRVPARIDHDDHRPAALERDAQRFEVGCRVLDALGVEPILDLRLRLGEGSGAALALPILRLACALHARMATFDEARISGPAP